MHLMPLFGSVLAVLFLHERFQLYHAAGIAMIAAGIVLASLFKQGGGNRSRLRCRTARDPAGET